MEQRTVLLTLSKHSVENEARKAREMAKLQKRHKLYPIALDDSWKKCDWPERLREQIQEYNILDFSKWEDAKEFDGMFKRLHKGLDLFYR